MMPRTEYEMSEDELKAILDSCKPVPAMMLSGGRPMFDSPQENANRAWARLGEKMGFDSMSVRPISGKGQRFFTAIPSESVTAREERLAAEAEENRHAEISRLEDEIQERRVRLEELTNEAHDNSQFGVGA